MSYAWSYAPTNRATCKGACKEKIEKGAVRFSVTTNPADSHQMISYRCLECVTDKQIANVTATVGGLDKVEGFELLTPADRKTVLAKLKGTTASPKGKAKAKAKEKTPAAEKEKAKAKAKTKAKAASPDKPATKAGTKRKAPPSLQEQHEFLDKAKNRDFSAVKEMILTCPELINVQPSGRWAALHQFAEGGDAEAVKFLLSKGADVTVKTSDGRTPADVAAGGCKRLLATSSSSATVEEEDDAEDEDEDAEEEVEEELEEADEEEDEEKDVTIPTSSSSGTGPPPAKKAKTSILVDSAVPGRDKYSVLGEWSALLNQTNVVANNNKYYRIQVLKSPGGGFSCWTHWGRVGLSGQHKLEPCANETAACNEFKKKFKEKSGVSYDSRSTHDWTPVVGKYTLVETDEQEGGEGGESAPLGKLTPQQIEKGQEVLKKLGDELRGAKKSKQTSLEALSSEYYTLIPHDFGMKKPPTIDTKDMLEAEEELLKFFMRMGFEEMDKADDGLHPISGVMSLDLPASLEAACKNICAAKDIKTSTEKGRQHSEKQSGSPISKMEASLYAAIMLYTSNAIYKDLNTALRAEDRNKIKKYFQYLRLLLEALGRLPKQNKKVWRGVGVDLYDQYKEGKEITWWGCSSCTADVNVAKNFMKGCGGACTLLTIETTTAADISAITFFGNEKENLLAPGTKLRVVKAERKGKVTEILMKEVGRVFD